MICFSMSSRYPDKVKVHVIGHTHEGREIRVVRIGSRWRKQEIFCITNVNFVTEIKRRDKAGPSLQYSSKEVGTRKGFLTTSIIPGIHAREWISPATVTYVMNELVTNPQHGSLLDMFDFFILPVANPDGLVICEVSINWYTRSSVNKSHRDIFLYFL